MQPLIKVNLSHGRKAGTKGNVDEQSNVDP
jgi:hypothetical protein